jgi:hypothetical protein
MIWLWARDAEELTIETRYESGYFVLRLNWPGGRPQVERFPDLSTFRTRLLGLEQELETAQWTNTGPPIIRPTAGQIDALSSRHPEASSTTAAAALKTAKATLEEAERRVEGAPPLNTSPLGLIVVERVTAVRRLTRPDYDPREAVSNGSPCATSWQCRRAISSAPPCRGHGRAGPASGRENSAALASW